MLLRRLYLLAAALVLVLGSTSTCALISAHALTFKSAHRACASLAAAVPGESAALTSSRIKEKCAALAKWTVGVLVALNTPVAMTDSNGDTVNRTAYDAWGNIEEQTANGVTQAPWQLPSYNPNDTGQAALLSNDGQSIGFTGYRKDEATGLYYAGARWYDPLIGSFNAMDPWAGDSSAPITFNKQLYGRANPLIYIDPDGRVSYLTTARDWFNSADTTLRSYATSMPMFANEIGAVRGVATLASLPVRVTNLVSDAVAQALPGQVFQGVAQQGSMELGKTLDEVVPLAVAYSQNPEGTKALMAIHLTKAASNTVVAAASGDGGARSDITSTAVQFGLPVALEPVLAAKLANFGGKANQAMQSADDVMRMNAQQVAREAQASADNFVAAQSDNVGAQSRVAVENPTALEAGTLDASNGAPSSSSGMPQWLREQLAKGNDFNKQQSAKYPHNEVYVEPPCAGRNCLRLDSYNPAAGGNVGEIVSRKFTQLAQVNLRTAINYLREMDRKYAPGTIIADVPSNRASGLAGQPLRGQKILEVPEQIAPVPKAVLDQANNRRIIIRDEFGNEH